MLGFAVSKKKKWYFVFYGIAFLFWVVHMLNCFRIGYTSLYTDAANYLRIINFPIFTLSLITFFQQGRDVRKSIYLGFAIDLGEVLLFTALPWALGMPVYTYRDLYVGVLGWFSTPSAQSAVVTLLVPMGAVVGPAHGEVPGLRRHGGAGLWAYVPHRDEIYLLLHLHRGGGLTCSSSSSSGRSGTSPMEPPCWCCWRRWSCSGISPPWRCGST